MRHCRACGFKDKDRCRFWEDLIRNAPIVGCSERFVRECCNEGLFGYCTDLGVFVANPELFLQKWNDFFLKDKVHSNPIMEELR